MVTSMNNGKKVGKIMADAMRYCWPYIVVNILVIALTTAVNLFINFLSRDILNQLTYDTVEGKLSAAFIGLVVMYTAFYLFQKASGFFRALGNNFYQFKVEEFFQDIFNWKSYTCRQEDFFDSRFLEKYSFARKGIGRISSHIRNLSFLIFSNIATIATIFVVFLNYSPILILFMVIVAVVSFVLDLYIHKKEYALDKEQIQTKRFHDYYKGLLVNKETAKELRIYHTKDHFYSIWLSFREKLRLENLNLALKKVNLHSVNFLFKWSIRVLSVTFLLIGAVKDRYDVGTFVLLFGFANSFCEQIDSLARSIVNGTYKDVKYIADYYDFVYPLTKEEKHQARTAKKEAFDLKWGAFRELKLNAVSYQYPNSQAKAVDSVSLSIRRGEIISILGYNGSGKTTLSKLLSGCLMPQNGTVTFNGVHITEENRMQLYAYFGFAPQEFPKFSVSIEEYLNLRCSRFEESQQTSKPLEVYEQLSMCHFWDRYPDGTDTILGKAYSDKGVDLSGGEWQFLNVASSFAGNPEIVLMDEPTASIDPVREEQIMRTLHENIGNRTVILISHRLGFARFADQIVFMEQGKITEQGNHDELMKSKGAYYNMFCKQQELYQ